MSFITVSGGTPGGLNKQVQFNDSGSFGGSSLLVYDKMSGKLSATQFAGGDFLFDNGWRLIEGDKLGKDKDSIYLLNAQGGVVQKWLK